MNQLVVAQQALPLMQYMNNALIYNPAAAGVLETEFNVGLISKLPTSFSSTTNRPLTNALWSDYRLGKKNMALGLNLNYDTYGSFANSNKKQTEVALNYAYHIPMGVGKKISLGLRGGISSLQYNADQLQAWDANDPTLVDATGNYMLGKIGFGVYYQSRTLSLGASAPDLFVSDKNNILSNNDSTFLKKRRNYMLNTAYVFKMGDRYQLIPSAILYYYPGTKAVVIGSLNLHFTDYFWVGGAYSSNQMVAFNAGTHLSARVRLGYAYQTYFTSTSDARFNSHEINLLISFDDLFK
jgi:type IX secretion system PorP/SprF family membrane protein